MNRIETEKMLEFDKVKSRLEELAYTARAKEKIRELTPSLSETEVEARLRETTEAKIMISKGGNPPVTALEGMEEIIRTAEIGGCLNVKQLEETAVTLTAVKRLKDYLNRCKQYEVGLAYYEANLDSLDELQKELNTKIRGGRVDDQASRQLKRLRSSVEQTAARMREKAEAVMRSQKDCMADSFYTMRGGRVCVPVKKEYKFRVSGAVIGKSATGNTVFIEPAFAARFYEELQVLVLEEEDETRRILFELTDLVASSSDALRGNYTIVEKLDFIFAKARLSLEYGGTEPVINTKRFIDLVNGRHPLMDREENVPLNFSIGRGNNGIVITGPNTGGKTVAIKTVALSCMMAQCGLHVACEKADICMNDLILCDIGDGQDLSENLSTFSAHIIHVMDILKKADQDSLVVMDELGSGTDPTEGMGIAIAILEELKKSGALYLVTTHYPEVKKYAEKETGVQNARMTFDKESLRPLYQLVIGEAGESCAFYIAKKLGMPGAMLRRAALAAYGKKADLTGYDDVSGSEELAREKTVYIKKKTVKNTQELSEKFRRGDSVMIYPDRKIGIVCEPVNEKGILRVQLPDKRIYINHKRVKLHVAADQLYPEDYDFSIVFDTVENRKAKHMMDRKHAEGVEARYEK